MKAQPTSSATRARINTVYPLTKRASSYTNAMVSSSRQQQPSLSPKSMAAASVSKRAPLRASTANSSSRRSTPPPQFQPSRLSQHAHQRALAAQRNAALAQRTASRNSHLSSLDRGIRLLLEEEYREDIKAKMLEKEKQTMASAAAMDQQPELQWHMRGHLLDFLLEIHLHFRLRPETLYLTLSILDRYVSRRIVYKKHYQLVGCVALWLAAKFEDAKERVPSVKDLKELCHGAYEEGAFVQMEGHVLGTVDWDLGHPTAESWLRVLCTETHTSSPTMGTGFGLFGAQGALGLIDGQPFEETRTQHVARFLMELALYGRDYLQFPPSIIALGALVLARQICGKPRRPADESAAVLSMISLLDHTLSQNLDGVSQTLVKKYSYAYYSKASGVVVSFYLRGGRFPLNSMPTVDKPESLTTHVVPVEALRQPIQVPVTPIRERTEVRWGSGSTDIEETPGLVRSDSSSSGMDMEEDYGEVMSSRATSEAREFEMTEDEDDDELEFTRHRHHHHQYPSSSSTGSVAMLNVPSSDLESMPITPTTPMFQLDPFGAAQQAQVHHAQVPPHGKDKENVVPGGSTAHLHHHVSALPCHPMAPSNVPGVVVEGVEEMLGEYRQALLAIAP